MSELSSGDWRIREDRIGADQPGTHGAIVVETGYGEDLAHLIHTERLRDGDAVSNGRCMAASKQMRNTLRLIARGIQSGHINNPVLIDRSESPRPNADLRPISDLIDDALSAAEMKPDDG